MKITKRYQKANRGLLVGGVLLLLVILYTWLSSVTFQSQKDDIQSVVVDFVNETVALQLEESTNEEKAEAFSALIDRFCTKKGINASESIDKEGMKACFSDFLGVKDERVKLTDYSIQFDEENWQKNFHITRAGVSYAKVMCNVRGYCEMEMPRGYTEYWDSLAHLAYLPGVNMDYSEYKALDDKIEEDPIEKFTGGFTYDVVFIMQRSGGKWKVNSVEMTKLWGDIHLDTPDTSGGQSNE